MDAVASVFTRALHLCASVLDVHVKAPTSTTGTADSALHEGSGGNTRFGVHALKLSVLVHEVKRLYLVLLAR